VSDDGSQVRWPAVLESERLYLRPPIEADAAVVNAGIRASFAELHVYMEWAQKMPSLAASQQFCASGSTTVRSGTAFPLLIFRRSDNAFVGASGFASVDLAVPSFELGYWCVTPHGGQGYITEATAMQLRHLFQELGAERAELRMDERNLRSAAVAERLGFTLEGTLRNVVRGNDGGLRNTRVYALLAAEASSLISP
jgi:RimJ/RimL family protein N-acetyltransferase